MQWDFTKEAPLHIRDVSVSPSLGDVECCFCGKTLINLREGQAKFSELSMTEKWEGKARIFSWKLI